MLGIPCGYLSCYCSLIDSYKQFSKRATVSSKTNTKKFHFHNGIGWSNWLGGSRFLTSNLLGGWGIPGLEVRLARQLLKWGSIQFKFKGLQGVRSR